LLDQETRPVPDFLRQECETDLGLSGVEVSKYISQEFHDLEVEKVWRKVWQMACREEEIPDVGDHVVYDIGEDSYIIVRSAPDKIMAFQNACLHRGRALRTQDGFVPEFRCPFHGFTWDLQGELKDVPARWDFPQIKDDSFCLPQAKVGTWGGFVFINMDPNCGSLEDYLEGLGEHFVTAPYEDRYMSVHVAKVIPANWKAMLEAFIESFHVIATHPQLLQSNGDENTEYSVWPDKKHISRSISPSGVPSPHLGDVDEQTVLDNYILNRRYYGSNAQGRDLDADDESLLDEGQTAREFISDLLRAQLVPIVGEERAESSTTSELLDAIQYFVFPNFVPWVATGSNIVYRFRPNGSNPNSSIAEIIFLTPVPPGQTKPPPVPIHWLTEEEDWTVATELGRLGAVANQDSGNVPYVQRGMRTMAARVPSLTLSRYQEVRIRHFHQTLDEYISAE
jgi:phenylpropionate dioxygenase-like ring-hydroxylating dioxygenase large terminal subunit